MAQTVSRDGTPIQFEATGAGPPLVLVSGSLDSGEETGRLVGALSDWHRVVVYARRGRGGSGDRPGSTVDDEIADLVAVIEANGGRADVFGASSGGVLALRAAAAGAPIDRLAVFEVPFDPSATAAEATGRYTRRLEEVLAADRRDDALELAMTLWGSPPEVIEGARNSEFWPPLREIAHTLLYDAHVMGDGGVPTDILSRVGVPVLVLTSGGITAEMGQLAPDFFTIAADAAAAALPDARRLTVPSPGHEVDPDALAPVLEEFFRRR